MIVFFFFKQKTAYEMRISDWSSDVCSSDLFRLEDAIAFLIWPASWLHPARTNNEASVAHGNEERDYCRRCSCPIINESCSQLSAESRRKIGVSINVNDLSDRTIDVHAFIPPAARDAQRVDSPSEPMFGRSEERRVGKELVRTCKI